MSTHAAAQDPGSVSRREQEFFDKVWTSTQPRRIEGVLRIPGVASLSGKRVLICSCGTGEEPVLAARAGAIVHAFDISEVAVAKARELAEYNGVHVDARVMDFHQMQYPADYFDVIYGSSILHHVDCAIVGAELRRCLKPDGIAFFFENSDRNPILRWVRRAVFGRPGAYQKSRVLFFHRKGTSDEYPLTVEEVGQLSSAFDGNVELLHDRFVFFQLLALHMWENDRFLRLTRRADDVLGSAVPALMPYSFYQYVRLQKPPLAARTES